MDGWIKTAKHIARRGRAQLSRLRAARNFPGLTAGWHQHVDELIDIYRDYTTTVSPASMAVSLNIAALLLHICRQTKPTRILDLGSGFSSAVFRLYAKSAGGVVVTSVDDDPTWLERSKEFSERHGLPTTGFVTYAGLREMPKMQYQIVFHDLGHKEMREAVLGELPGYLSGSGIMVIDDAQRRYYRGALKRELRRHNMVWGSLEADIRDEFWRYCWVARHRDAAARA